MESVNVSAMLTKLTDSEVFLDAISITRTGLDSFKARPTDSHLPALAQKSAGGDADNTIKVSEGITPFAALQNRA